MNIMYITEGKYERDFFKEGVTLFYFFLKLKIFAQII